MSTYKTGTVSVSNSNAVVTGSGTAWAVALVAGGMFSSAGLAVPIASVNSDTSLTLDYPWPGTTASGVAYSIALESSEAASVANMNATLSRVLVTLSLAGITPDASGTIAERNALTLAVGDKGFLFLHAEVGVAFAFYRWTGTAWVGPFTVADAVAGGGVTSIVAGSNVTIDNTNPAIPVISSTGVPDGSVSTAKLADDAVSNAKLSNMATSRIKGRATAATGDPEDLTLTQVLDMVGSAAQGDILFRSASTWSRLAKGTALQVLRQNTALTAPEWASAREVLTANRTFYVRTDGNDSNTGLVNNSGGAFQTIQKAIDTAATLDLSIYSVVIQCGTGTGGTSQIFPKSYVGVGPITLQGDTTTPSNVTIAVTNANCILANGVIGKYVVTGFKFTAATSGYAISASGASKIDLGVVEFGACASGHIDAEQQAIVTFNNNYTISGAGTRHWFTTTGALIQCTGKTITLTGTPAFTSGFLIASRDGGALVSGNTFSGSATGTRYVVTFTAWADVAGAGASYLPGDAAGSTATGGTYG